jgi:hypothetical protein
VSTITVNPACGVITVERPSVSIVSVGIQGPSGAGSNGSVSISRVMTDLIVAVNTQMIVYQNIIIEATLTLEGDLVII